MTDAAVARTVGPTAKGAPEAPATGVDQPQYLTFAVDGEEYAVGILRVREILEYDTVTRVPGTPDYIRGVINLRGAVVPVLDLAVKLGLEAGPVTKRTCIVIVEVELDSESVVIGIVADSVSQVIELGAGEIEPPPTFGTRIHVDYLLGMGRAGKKFVLILDTDRLLAAEEVAAVSDATAAATEQAAIGTDAETAEQALPADEEERPRGADDSVDQAAEALFVPPDGPTNDNDDNESGDRSSDADAVADSRKQDALGGKKQ